MNYIKKKKEIRQAASELNERQTADEILNLINDPAIVGVVGNILSNKAFELLRENVEYRGVDLMMGHVPTPSEGAENLRRDEQLLEVVKLGYLLGNIKMHFDSAEFMKSYLKKR